MSLNCWSMASIILACISLHSLSMAASASFSTPLGYQTNLMVLAPGGYKFGDYLRVGVPLNILGMVMTVGLTPLFFEF